VALLLTGPCQELADLQHGVIARWQALAGGLAPDTIRGQLRGGRWQPFYRGVYLTFTGEPSRMAQLWGAVLRAGPGAALSHHTAAELDNLSDKPSSPVHVTIGGARRVANPDINRLKSAPAITLHHCARIAQARHPSRTPPRTRIEETTLDLIETSRDLDEALSWLSRACGRRLTTPHLLRAAMANRPKLRWRQELAGALPLVGEGVHSGLEWRYVHHVERAHGLPRAIRQARSRVGQRTRYLDNHYVEFHVVVELDGRAAHPAEARWRDIHRDNATATLGIITLRYGWADITTNPCRVAAEIAQVLHQHGWKPRPRRCSPACTIPPS
jgi:hypothetical protein